MKNDETLKQYRVKLTYSIITPNVLISILLLLKLPRGIMWVAGVNLILSYIIYYVLISKKKKEIQGDEEK